ncbi:hypothetical protein JQ615_21090 [Bradyrhizobium jicamae]|uniref:DUF998 domain-containing protein n=1 Tax=Bradyrhizobium jicamae TaxID=280332 RepID=A0ABS5FM50_9BRAD|nr:hypothetical protein [Bradyrhizobium jicamae]MBR0797887.1 hypothetical protein [Bradyrhizobium jicamae]MBR0935918.1 hypothetical protein [Bradyrhizobium jicamae]
MMSFVIGLSNLGVGLAYAGLGLLAVWETITLHDYRGWSRFGLGFAMMAASCGPHHLVHGWDVLQGASISLPMLAVTLIGMPAGLTFVWLRLETMWGGRGERLVTASPHRVALLTGAFTVLAGWLAASAFNQSEASLPFQFLCTSTGPVSRTAAPETGIDFVSVSFLANVFVTITYGMVGFYLADHQVRRHIVTGAWSLSGLALTGVFFTCAQMHLIDATTVGSGPMLVFDLIGVPASIYFLWVVKQVHSDAVLDWNRRPLVGTAAAPARPSPWSGASAQH